MEISQIIKERAVSIMFQPIQNIETQEVLGFEALARGPGRLYSPMNLLRAANKVGMLQQMELLCLSRALEDVTCLPDSDSLEVFVNISPGAFISYHEEITKLIKDANYRVVLEIAEIGLNARKQNSLVSILSNIRNQGIKVALDDIGSGDRNFRNICEIPSDYLKIDRCIIEGLTRHQNGAAPHYLAALKALVSIAKDLDSKVIAEGIETPMQLTLVRDAGIHFVQGFLISKPLPTSYWSNQKEASIC